ncbi:MarR family winged helix-turn-helix transcriptional regulator [Rhodococcus sp. IEGM 1379]|uniref:MarR family winged helix-turn-helix transcriptional regulator n=1 Tax=Rhodococcus sp. IEGM 1379 TaxID=3047086 RepID=UPI0024B83CD5|nr:MarR family winged helix-turn-helix transcriptional regulator [Rhodococcus sp. IEGM 1379]MDI9916837.1 MarR family winged helix-turn-helix transcriptional regulator [Rhodococcus sp. IEGM 1379]
MSQGTEEVAAKGYVLDDNIGYLLRRCYQESTALFSGSAPVSLSAPRFAALVRLVERGPLSQNRLGRLISADAATIKGIVGCLRELGAVEVSRDPHDKRQRLVSVTDHGRQLHAAGVVASQDTAADLLAGLSDGEAKMFVELLQKVAGRRSASGEM